MLAEGGGQATEEEEKKEEVGRDVLLQSRDPWGKTCRRDMMPTLISFLSKLMILQVLAKNNGEKDCGGDDDDDDDGGGGGGGAGAGAGAGGGGGGGGGVDDEDEEMQR